MQPLTLTVEVCRSHRAWQEQAEFVPEGEVLGKARIYQLAEPFCHIYRNSRAEDNEDSPLEEDQTQVDSSQDESQAELVEEAYPLDLRAHEQDEEHSRDSRAAVTEDV